MIYTLFGFNYIFNLQNFQLLFLAASLGLYLRLLLSIISHQLWLKNYSQYLVFALLPITGYVITSIISSNIALSLGMVGALSIVRFRTPVKNPSELVIYFLFNNNRNCYKCKSKYRSRVYVFCDNYCRPYRNLCFNQ